MAKPDGGPAMPSIRTEPRTDSYSRCYGDVTSYGGMTLRDWFAGQALVGLLAHDCDDDSRSWKGIDGATSRAYEYADAMLAEREKSL